MAVARPSKAALTAASGAWASMATTARPWAARPQPSVSPARPPPTIQTSVSWITAVRDVLADAVGLVRGAIPLL